ncbi:MAG: hypothetical protein E6G92_05360 [Alphaproteobacteria bacterium]|jgi:hypothetical protein|nr:MAG: hypothetical protein E6G92_05360 [Alphaproteobacteria bacterium]
MKKIVFVSALLASGAAWAQAPSSGQANESGFDPNELVCRTVDDTGSRLGRQRICMTRQQWVDSRRLTRENTERTQNNRGARQF